MANVQQDNGRYIKETIILRNDIEGSFLELGKRLFHIHNEKMWRGQYESYEEFLEEIKLKPSVASRLETVYTVYIVEHKVPMQKLVSVGYSNLYTAIPLLGSGSAVDVVERAGSLTRKDLEQELRDAKHGECAHDGEYEVFHRCKKCGRFNKIHEQE